ncbi:MAG TPA: AFG1/ZapE family ATPase [Thermoanaerobaculia bacterium]|nr:AFG1/ZapE family ATPase [Thermoanaerobaculia bacterium]
MSLIPASGAVCERCSGSGWVPLAGDSLRAEPCHCQGDLRRRQRIGAANIPRRYFPHCTLQTFHVLNSASLVAGRRKVQEFVDEWPGRTDGRGLLLVGACGVGKTHLAVAALVEIINSNKPGRLLFCNFQDLIQEIQASFDSDEVPSKSEILRPLLEADLLVLDELGSQKPTQFVQDTLYYVINTRYNDTRTTIFTTNYFDEAADREQRLQERIGERLRSRLHEMTELVEIRGVSDYRTRNMQSRNIMS